MPWRSRACMPPRSMVADEKSPLSAQRAPPAPRRIAIVGNRRCMAGPPGSSPRRDFWRWRGEGVSAAGSNVPPATSRRRKRRAGPHAPRRASLACAGPGVPRPRPRRPLRPGRVAGGRRGARATRQRSAPAASCATAAATSPQRRAPALIGLAACRARGAFPLHQGDRLLHWDGVADRVDGTECRPYAGWLEAAFRVELDEKSRSISPGRAPTTIRSRRWRARERRANGNGVATATPATRRSTPPVDLPHAGERCSPMRSARCSSTAAARSSCLKTAFVNCCSPTKGKRAARWAQNVRKPTAPMPPPTAARFAFTSSSPSSTTRASAHALARDRGMAVKRRPPRRAAPAARAAPSYQQRGVPVAAPSLRGRLPRPACAWDELGKTRQVARGRDQDPPHLYCPASVVPVWRREIASFRTSPSIAQDRPRFSQRTVRDLARRLQLPQHHARCSPAWTLAAVLLDEGQFIKNPDAKERSADLLRRPRRSSRRAHRHAAGEPLQLDLWNLPLPAARPARITRLVQGRAHRRSRGTLTPPLLVFVILHTKSRHRAAAEVEMDLICPLTDVQRAPEYARICSEGASSASATTWAP